MNFARLWLTSGLVLSLTSLALGDERLEELKREAIEKVEARQKLAQVMVDSIFSFSELGFQEFETSRYVTAVLEENGFAVERGIAGIPTAWVARWGSGKPVISFGSDIDGIPKASQKPGVAYHEPLIPGAPGHGEGHNSGQAVNVVAALALKEIMEREKIPGTLMLWPGVAEEQLAGKAFLVRAGLFKDVDMVFFTHVGSDLNVSWGQSWGSGLVSVEYVFRGESAHSAGAPWRGRSALDAVELMNMAWNMRREHLRLAHRLHYVITNGGDQPNVVPSSASVWYYYRELDYENIKRLFDIGETISTSAAAMTATEVESRILGEAWPLHFNKEIAETMYENIKTVGLPKWSEADQKLAIALQDEMKFDPGQGEGGPWGGVRGLRTDLSELMGPAPEPRTGGGSDDVGDISWNVPTVTLSFPSNFESGGGHHWSSAVAMATPIAHKGAVAGAKVMAMTAIDFFLDAKKVDAAWKYFREVQTKEVKYVPLLRETDMPPVHLNREIMAEFRDQMKKLYYDPAKYDTYLEQLGIEYPTVRKK